MPDPQDAQQALEALALTGATAVVTAMATDSWQAIRARTLELFRRHRPSRGTAGIEADLDGAGRRSARLTRRRPGRRSSARDSSAWRHSCRSVPRRPRTCGS